jgi:hypothetical protein
MGVMIPRIKKTKWEPSRVGLGITLVRSSRDLTMETDLGVATETTSWKR